MNALLLIALFCLAGTAMPAVIVAEESSQICEETEISSNCTVACDGDMFKPMQCCSDRCWCVETVSGKVIEGSEHPNDDFHDDCDHYHTPTETTSMEKPEQEGSGNSTLA